VDQFQHGDQVTDAASAVDEQVVLSVEHTCRILIDGRRAGRAIGVWLRESGLVEPEFQVLWCLRDASGEGLDQTALASRLAYSAAQVSATVERLNGRGWITQQSRSGDRRRHVWQLSANGRVQLQSILSQSVPLLNESTSAQSSATAGANQREVAA
jgi:DNA-binding MarR family transcriptional regulator